jgi:hypothetical protein
MKMHYQNQKQPISAVAAALILFAGMLTSCNAHQKAAKLIGNTVKEQMGKFVQNEEIAIQQKINQIECFIPSPTVSDIISEKTELIATY